MSLPKYPNLFIVGAAKSGTTFLWDAFNNIDEIYFPQGFINKEPSYFSSYLKWISAENYDKLYELTDRDYTYKGDASTAYLSDPTSAERIFKFNPNSKIIISLRNPARRAYSLYNWMAQSGYEPVSTFEKALALEERRFSLNKFPVKGVYPLNYLYYSSGLYYEQVKRYYDIFPKENVHIIKFEELVLNPVEEIHKAFQFLMIDTSRITIRRKMEDNASHQVISPYLQYLLRKMTFFLIKKKLFHYTTMQERDRIVNLGLLKRNVSSIKKATYIKLIGKYENDIINLHKLLPFKQIDKWLME